MISFAISNSFQQFQKSRPVYNNKNKNNQKKKKSPHLVSPAFHCCFGNWEPCVGYWRLTTMEIKNDFWSQGLILFIFFHSLKQCLQIIQVKASQKQNNIIKALLHTDTFSYAACLTVSLNPVWWESSCTLQGILLELFWLQQRVAKQNSLALEMCSVLAPQSLIPSSVFIIHRDSIWEALGGAVKFPGAPPHLQCSDLDLGAWRLGPALWVGGGYGAENEKAFIKKNLTAEPLPALVPPKITLASLIKLDQGLGTGMCLKRTEEAERGRGKCSLGKSLTPYSNCLFSGLKVPNNVSARECIFLSLLPPPRCVSLLMFFTHDGLFAVLALHSSFMFLS